MHFRGKGSIALFILVFTCAAGFPGVGRAQDDTTETLYKKRLTQSTTVTAFREFGDQINLRDGTMTFKNVDVLLEGTGPDIKVVRTAQVHDNQINRLPTQNNMGAWMFEIPRIKAVTANGSNFGRAPMDATSPVGWQIGNAADKNSRCTNFGYPGDVTFGGDRPVEFMDISWFFGYTLVDMDGAEHPLGVRSNQLPAQQYKLGTNDGWVVSCLAQTANGEPGEAFLATSPDGTKFWFDYLSYTDIRGYAEAFPDMPPKGYTLTFTLYRRAAAMLVTRIEDRYGNYLAYSYNAGRLASITSSDGRRVDVTHGNSVTSISTGTGRTWSYQYADVEQTQLSSVVQPDGSSWTYSGDFSGTNYSPNYYHLCTPPSFPGTTVSRMLVVGSPSGATATYGLGDHIFGRSYLVDGCTNGSQRNPNRYVSLAILAKSVTGPSVNEMWQYQYSPHNASYTSECSAGCPTEVYTDEITPEGIRKRYVFSNKYDRLENALLRTEVYSSSGVLARRSSNTYAIWDGAHTWPWPAQYVTTVENPSNYMVAWQIRPLMSRVIEEGGSSYVRNVNSFDVFGRPLSVTRTGPGTLRTDATTYFDDQGRWVLGQLAKLDNLESGKEVSRTTFNASAQPAQRYAFGQLRQSLTYNPDGTVATIVDANNNTIALSSYKRGLPRRIDYPGATYAALDIDDNGWISSVRDEAGYTTGFNYDAMGRMTKTTYPVGDTVAWEPLQSTFGRLAASDPKPQGTVTGQWLQTTWQGNYRKLTYFDALWRPVLVNSYDNANVAGTMSAIRYQYDSDGQATFISYPSSQSGGGNSGVWAEYDGLGRQTSQSQDSELGLLTTVTQYLSGNQILVTDPRGQITNSTYQAFDTPNYSAPTQIQHPEGAFTEITRDVFGNPVSILRRNSDGTLSVTRQYVYDGLQRLCKQIEPETGATAFGYDNVGNLTWSAAGLALPDPVSCDTATGLAAVGARVDRTYDARNRLRTLSFYSRNGNQTWDYTADGMASQIVTENNAGASRTINQYTYNGRRLLTGESSGQEGAFTWSLGYGYSANGALASIRYPSTSLVVDYAPNALGQPTKAGTYASGVTYYPNGAMAQFTYGNGLVHTMSQNSRQLPAQVADGNVVLNHAYAYDKSGNVTQITDGIMSSSTRVMQYDGLSRLTKATSASFGAGGVIDYTYDALDNLRTAKLAGGAFSPTDDIVYSYDGKNRLANTYNSATEMTASMLYDTQGNLVNKNGKLFEFDTGNRLRRATNLEEYRYDGYGRRVGSSSATGAGSIWSMYGQDGTLRRQANDREAKVYEYVSLNGSLIARVVTSTAPAAPVLTGPPYSYNGSFSLQWGAVATATSYKLEESFNASAYVVVQNTSAVSWSTSGRQAGTYTYRVSGCQPVCGSPSTSLTVSVQLPPASAPMLSIQPTPRAVLGNYTVNWTAVGGATAYALEESVNGGAFSVVSGVNGTSKGFTSRAAARYTYRVTAANEAGLGPVSNSAYTDAVYAPSTPAITIIGNGLGAFTVSWSAVPDTTAYRMEESVNGGAWTYIATTGSSYPASGKANGSYSYHVQACNELCGSFSAAVGYAVLWPPASPTTPSVPASSTTGAYTISWSPVPTAVTYQLEESLNGGGWMRIHDEGATQRPVSGRGDGTYRYRVQAWNSSGYGAYSGEAAVVVSLPPPIPAMPIGLNCVFDIDNSTKPVVKETDCSWGTAPYATYYQLGKDTTGTNLWYQGSNLFFTVFGTSVKTFYLRACNATGCSAWKGPVTL
ncbi:MAG TPA: RHS repeat protein [Stenotrophomonas sp.]